MFPDLGMEIPSPVVSFFAARKGPVRLVGPPRVDGSTVDRLLARAWTRSETMLSKSTRNNWYALVT